jgi:glycosyltransferase involved in cell wall biosynthesis
VPAVVCHGPYLREQLLQVGVKPNRLFEFNWGFRHLREQSEGLGIQAVTDDGASTVILFVGRIQDSKGVFELLDACTERLRAEPQLKLIYAGEGSDLEELRRRALERGLAGQVVFPGMVPHSQLASVIRQSKLVVTPTRGYFPEGRCMAAIESLVMEVPVIAPDFGPFPYLVKHGDNGLLFKTDSVEDLKQKIDAVLDNLDLYRRLRAGAAVSSRVLRNPSVNFSQAVTRAFELQEKPRILVVH